MKKLLTLFSFLPALAQGQSLVSSSPQNRTALLEDFTGIHCGYCPEGHTIMADLAEVHGDQLVNVGVHANVYAVPSGSEPDFRTDEGTEIDAFFPITGYPAGVINRHNFTAGLALGRGAWEGAVNEVLEMPSPVNVGVESSYDGTNLTVHVVAFYTADSPNGNDYISVLVNEDHLIGWQTDYANGDHANYDHLHVLRGYLTETWGEDVGNHVAGEMVERTYTFPVPPEWTIANCKVVAFVSEYQSEVYQARAVAADGGSTLVIGDLQGDPVAYQAGSNAASTTFSGSFTNQLNADEDYTITLTNNGSPVSWSNGFTVDGIAQSNPATVSIANGGTIDLDVNIVPDAAPGIGKYTLTVASTTNPGAPILSEEYHIISGVHDLIVTNPQAEQWEPLYVDGMWNESAKAVTNRVDFVAFGQADALDDVYNLYLNISWTFPSYTDDVANVLSAFLDNGGNLMIAGQDIGWDQSGQTGSYGTPVTQAFYEDYLHATFVADGSTADTQALFEDGDLVFGSLWNTTIVNIFGGANMYPDQITPIAPAVPVLRYSATKIGGLRVETANYKVVYFGIGPEQAADVDIAHLMVQASHDWFYGLVGVEELDAALNLGQAYPSPADSYVNIPVGEHQGTAVLEVFDATGRMLMSTSVSPRNAIITLGTEHLGNGVYSARLRTNEGVGQARTFQVMR